MDRRSFISLLRTSLLAGIVAAGAHAWRSGRIRFLPGSECRGESCGHCPVLPDCHRAQAAEFRAARTEDHLIHD
ncbi:MAG: hypothetical protein EHM72_08145 [Calditrichaeota bacterium]|nr:MAG: hypothetical protein EHM72_08145 [Calditrichota bacterium]